MKSLYAIVKSIDKSSNGAFVVVLEPVMAEVPAEGDPTNVQPLDGALFVQSEEYTEAGIAATPYGTILFDGTDRLALGEPLKPPAISFNGATHLCSTDFIKTNINNQLSLTEQVSVGEYMRYVRNA